MRAILQRWHQHLRPAGPRWVAGADEPPTLDVLTRLAVVGDVGHESPARRGIVAAMVRAHHQRPFDGLVLLGDNVYPSGDPALVGHAVLEPFAPLLDDGVPLLAVLGNHDVEAGHGDEVARRLGMPGRWYCHDLGRVRVIALDSTQAISGPQTAWLERTLARPWDGIRVVALHHPAHSAGWHGSHREVRAALSPLLAEHDVALVLAGHDHDYQRSIPIDGTVHVVSGAATHLRPAGRGRRTAAATSRHHWVDLWVGERHASLWARGSDGGAFDVVRLDPRLRGDRRADLHAGHRP